MPSDSLEGENNQITCMIKLTESFYFNGFSMLVVWNQQEPWKKDPKAEAQRF